jgi:signal transduction histidine kinase
VIAAGRARYGSVTSAGERLRVYVAPLAAFGGAAAGGAVVVAASDHDVAHTLANLRLFLVLAGIAAAVLAAVAVFLLQRRALSPVTRLADAAAEVERTGDPRRRLPLPPSNDEVGRLANTLNEMLASLERARDRERRFLADASHELRTPLTALRGNIGYLARHGSTPELLADLELDAERLARLADDLLALSREEASAVPEADVRLDELARGAAGRHPGLEVDAPERVTVRGEPGSLERALDNLLENARVHGPKGGAVTLSVERNGGVARVTVADQGEGLRVEEKQLAFQRFWRREADRPGSGLGLAIVRATAERHGGRAYADGARFTIELPLSGTSHGPGATTSGQEETEKGRS